MPPPVTPPRVTTGVLTSLPLPALVGAPFSTNMRCKQTNMMFCPLDGQIWISGGDWVGSATDGTWTYDPKTGAEIQVIGDPIYPTLPAPHALQDDALMEWSPSRKLLLIAPGDYFPYPQPFDPIKNPEQNYSMGHWWLDPVAKKYTQDLRIFKKYGENTGSPNGGIWDENNGHIVEFGDSSSDFQVHRWDVDKGVRLPDLGFGIVRDPKRPASYFTQGQQVVIGRKVYIIGFRTNGDTSSQTPLCLCWDLDAHTMTEMAPPPVDGTLIRQLEIRLGVSHGKVVWPFTFQPQGDIHGIHVYDPATNGWASDMQVPTYGNFIGNSVVSLPDGRIGFCGGVFGLQQTHFWFYEAR